MKKTRFYWPGFVYALILGLMTALLTGIPAVYTVAAAMTMGLVLPYIAPELTMTGSLFTLGYAPALLRHLNEMAMGNAPSVKVSSPGYLLMLAQQGKMNVLNEGQFRADGTVRDMRVKYRNRPLESAVETEDNCDINGVPVYAESEVSCDNVAKYAFYIDDTEIAKYTAEAAKMKQVGGKPDVSLMTEHVSAIFEMLNAFYGKMDTTLVAQQASAFGINIRTGAATATTVNINDDSTVNLLTEGLTRILADYTENELVGIPYIVGSGLFNNFYMQQAVKGMAQNGEDTTKYLNQFKFYYDRKCASGWGANQIGVFAPGSVVPIYRNEYVGDFAGKKGESIFFTMTPQITDVMGNPLTHELFTLDVQLKYIDCPQDLADAGYAGTYDAKRGWFLIFKKAYDQFNLPSDAYDANDDFYQVNGSLRYAITNS